MNNDNFEKKIGSKETKPPWSHCMGTFRSLLFL
jgi:hypothetical protein